MSCTRNANEFLKNFRLIRQNYENHFREKINKIRRTYENNPINQLPQDIDDSLEIHARQYVINELLQALNWRLNCSPTDGLPNLVPEVPIGSVTRGTTRFLDYLGFERACEKPLLIVEAKRPNSTLPLPIRVQGETALLILHGLNGNTEALNREWNEWLTTLRDYVRTTAERTHHIPERVVITNGDWLIIFKDPAEAFGDSRLDNPNSILVWNNRVEIEQRYTELYRELEYSTVAGEKSSITLEELPFYVQPGSVTRLMHGIRLTYYEDPHMYFDSIPKIEVAPLIFIGTEFGSLLRVECQNDQNIFNLPYQYDELEGRLNDVKAAAERLLNQVKTLLNITQNLSSLSEHYSNQDSLDLLSGVREDRYNADKRVTHYIIVTGQETHFLKPEPSVANCPYHQWNNSQQHGVAISQPVNKRSINNPRSFFIDNEPHHCTHQGVYNAKSSQITKENRDRCGPRSQDNGCTFCEIYSIDQLICCRTCCLEEICTRAQVFVLPC